MEYFRAQGGCREGAREEPGMIVLPTLFLDLLVDVLKMSRILVSLLYDTDLCKMSHRKGKDSE